MIKKAAEKQMGNTSDINGFYLYFFIIMLHLLKLRIFQTFFLKESHL